MVGTVSIVRENYIKITCEAVQLTGYMPSSSVLPGLLFYSSLHVPGEECTNYDQLDKPSQVAIETTGSEAKATNRPGVYHSEDKPGCVNLENPSECYELGGLQYIGLIYASHGIVATSGDAATYVGSVVAYTIRVNGGMQRNGSNPQKVGALFVYDDTLFPPSEQFIVLDN